jgi:hypothetical protein
MSESLRPARCASLLRREAPQRGWTLAELTDEIQTRCGCGRLRAHRLARGWTLQQLISANGDEHRDR